MRVCRICLTNDITKSFESVFAFNGRTADQLHSLFNIVVSRKLEPNGIFHNLTTFKIIELPNVPALICRKCEKHVAQAMELKKLCETSERHFKQDSKNEYYFIHENLRELKATSKKVANEASAPPVIPQVLTILPKTLTTTKTTEISTGSPKVVDLPMKSRRNSLRIKEVPLRYKDICLPNSHLATESVNLGKEPPTKRRNTASIPDPVITPAVKSEASIENECDSTADTEVSINNNNLNDLEFVDSLTIDQIKELTDVLSGILMPSPAKEKSKKKKKKRDKNRFVQKLAPTRLRIKMRLTTKGKG